MTIQEYAKRIAKDYRATNRTDIVLRDKLEYAKAYTSGETAIDELRSRLISRKIAETYDINTQIAILFNKDSCPTEYEAYQAFRAECKSKVDAKMAALKAELVSFGVT